MTLTLVIENAVKADSSFLTLLASENSATFLTKKEEKGGNCA